MIKHALTVLVVALLLVACSSSDDAKRVEELEKTVAALAAPTSAANSSLADECLDFLDGYGDASNTLEQLTRQRVDLLAEGTTASRTSRWQNDMRSVDRRVQAVRDDVARLDAPTAAYKSIKANTLEALDLRLAGSQLTLEGITSFNTDLMLDGTKLLERAAAADVEILAMMRAVDPLDCF